MDSMLDDSVFDVPDASSDFEPEAVSFLHYGHTSNDAFTKPFLKVKAKAAPKPKKAAAPKAAPKKATQTTLKAVKKAPTKKRAKPESDDDEDPDILMSGTPIANGSILSSTPPSAKKQKKAPAPKKGVGKPLASLENEAPSFDGANDAVPLTKASKDASDRYQKVSSDDMIQSES